MNKPTCCSPQFRWRAFCLLAVLTSVSLFASSANAQHSGIQGKRAPELKVSTWANLPDGKESFQLKDHSGKVVFLYCFQAHCSGCRSSGFPRMKKLYAKYRKDEQIQFVAVQTTFGSDTFAQAKNIMDEFDLKGIPVGHDVPENGLPKTSRAYQTGGTPWMAVIDKKGMVRANRFHIDVDVATALIERLKAE